MTPHTPLHSAFRSRLARAAMVAALALCVLAPMAGPHVERASGRVEIGSGEPPVWRAARAGDALAPGDAVRTGRDGRAELVLPSGSIRLYGDSLLRLPAAAPAPGSAEAVDLESGSSLFDVLHRSRDLFEVHTPEVVVSIKGTRFLVVAGERAEVAVFRGSVGLRGGRDAAHELLVREGFAAVGSADRPFELLWSGAPDPWDTWTSGGLPPRANEPAGAGISPGGSALEAARAAARAESRREAVEQAIERHPDVAERVEKAIAAKEGKGPGGIEDVLPAAPAPDAVVDGKGDSGEAKVEESYVESVLNGGTGSGSSGGGGQGGGSVPNFDVTLIDDAVVVTGGGQTWTLSEDVLESVKEGDATLPPTLESAIGAQGTTPEQFAAKMLKLLD